MNNLGAVLESLFNDQHFFNNLSFHYIQFIIYFDLTYYQINHRKSN